MCKFEKRRSAHYNSALRVHYNSAQGYMIIYPKAKVVIQKQNKIYKIK